MICISYILEYARADQWSRKNGVLFDIEHRFLKRLEWDLNPRMSVLQTDALGHLAIQPDNVVARAFYRISDAKSRENLTFFSNKSSNTRETQDQQKAQKDLYKEVNHIIKNKHKHTKKAHTDSLKIK